MPSDPASDCRGYLARGGGRCGPSRFSPGRRCGGGVAGRAGVHAPTGFCSVVEGKGSPYASKTGLMMPCSRSSAEARRAPTSIPQVELQMMWRDPSIVSMIPTDVVLTPQMQ